MKGMAHPPTTATARAWIRYPCARLPLAARRRVERRGRTARSTLEDQVHRDLRAPAHAVGRLRAHEAGDEAPARRVGAHHDRVATEPPRLLDDALGALARAEHAAVG